MNEIRLNSPKAWFLAARPKTLTGAAVPVMIGCAMAAHDMSLHINWIPAVLCFLFAFVMQIDANFVNDYFDWRRGNDDEATRLGPLRACSQGWVSPKAMIIALVATTCLGGLIGLPLIIYGGWEMILVGVACVAFCILYTTTLSYLALGDVLVLVFFGIVPVCFTYYLQTGNITMDIFKMSLLCGLAIDNLLIVNNYRDIDNDRRDKKRTLIVLVGRKAGFGLYVAFGFIAAGFLFRAMVPQTSWAYLLVVYLVLHSMTASKMRQLEGRALNLVLGETARNIFVYGLMVSLIFLLA